MTESPPILLSSRPKDKTSRSFLTRHKKTIIISSSIFALSIVFNLTLNRIFILDIDEAHLIKRIMAVLTGELPLIDFIKFTYAPGHYWFFGFFFKLFGPSIILERFIWVILRALVSVITYLLSRYLIPNAFVFLPVVLAMTMTCIPYKTMVPFLSVLNLYVLFIYIDKKKSKWLILSGIVSGLTLWVRQDIGIFLLITACLCIFCQSFSLEKLSVFPLKIRMKAQFKKILARQGLFFSSLILSFVPLVAVYGIYGKAVPFLKLMFLQGPLDYINRKGTTSRQFPHIKEIFKAPADWDAVFLWSSVFVFVFIFLLLSYRILKQRKFTKPDLFVLATLIMSVLTFNLTVQNALFERILENAVPMYILAATILAWKYGVIKTWLESRIRGQTKIAAIKCTTLVLLLSVPVFFIVYGLTRKNVNDRLVYKRRPLDIVRSDSGVWLVRGQISREIRGVRRAISKESRQNDQIVFITTALIFYHSNKRGLVDFDLQIEHFNENNLRQYFTQFNPQYVAVENWALKYFRWLSTSFRQDFELNYTPMATRAGHTVFTRTPKRKSKAETD
jgi:hypothetical protein